MSSSWRWLSYILLGLLSPTALVHATASFENTAIVKTVSLGGSTVHVTTTYSAKALDSGAEVYEIALSHAEKDQTSWLEASLKGSLDKLPVQELGFDPSNTTYLVGITLPNPVKEGAVINLIVDTILTRATWPWPQRASQTQEQSLKFESDLFILSPYRTLTQRTKIRSPSPRIISFTNPRDVQHYTTENAAATRAGTTVTYGPFNNVEPVNAGFVQRNQQRISIHYGYEMPVLEVTNLKRAAEISHWGANLNIQDEIYLHNAGPELKGHFSRIEHQTQNFQGRPSQHVLSSLALHLPTGIRNVYYYDLVGNVSTSRLIVKPSPPRGSRGSNQYSILDLKPRYPLLGGWNYSFTLGWDASLGDSTTWDPNDGRYIAAVPVLTPIPGAAVTEAEVSIVLPEGATDVEYFLPFPALSASRGKHTTYLDTIGRPVLTFTYKHLTEKHTSPIYVSYKVPFSAHLRKPIAVTTAICGLFLLALGGRRMDFRIHKRT